MRLRENITLNRNIQIRRSKLGVVVIHLSNINLTINMEIRILPVDEHRLEITETTKHNLADLITRQKHKSLYYNRMPTATTRESMGKTKISFKCLNTMNKSNYKFYRTRIVHGKICKFKIEMTSRHNSTNSKIIIGQVALFKILEMLRRGGI